MTQFWGKEFKNEIKSVKFHVVCVFNGLMCLMPNSDWKKAKFYKLVTFMYK